MRRLKRAITRSIRLRFTLAILALAIIPLVTAAALLTSRTYTTLEQQSITLQREVATGVAGQLEAILLGRQQELALLDEVAGIGDATYEEQVQLIENLLAEERMYQVLSFVGADGVEQIRVDRRVAVLPDDLETVAAEPAFIALRDSGDVYFGPVWFDQEAREPLTTVGYPLIDRRTGNFEAALIATVRFKPMWDVLAGLERSDGSRVFLTTADGDVVAHPDPAVVLRESTYDLPEEDGSWVDLDGEPVAAATFEVILGDQELYVVAEQPLSVAYAVANRGLAVGLMVVAATLLAAAALLILGGRLFISPIEELARSAHKVARGDLGERAVVRSEDEIGELAYAYNRMVAQLQGLVGGLERRVAERTEELQSASTLQQELIAELEESNEQLLDIQARLEQTMRSKDEFLCSVSHELRTPLSSVLGFSTLLRDHSAELSEKEFKEFTASIAEQGQDMADIINDLLVAARADSGDIAIDPQPFDLTDDIRKVIATLSHDRVALRAPAEPAVALADPVRVRQILRNLIVNADRYGGDNVAVDVARQNGNYVVQVRDDGDGIPEPDWEAIFQPYHRAHHNAGQPASVGLGLTVSRMLARRMDGDLTYRYKDGVSIFELSLPRAVF